MSLSTSTVNIPTPQHPVPFKRHLMQQVNLERKRDMITAVESKSIFKLIEVCHRPRGTI
ncbi:unnamed protein product [Debaryomyces tyrocola]|nr:unnamed protein product [Debaryomyces tyrocola]